MSQLSLRARICLLVLTPVTLATLAVTISQHASGRLGFVHFTVWTPQAPDGYPVVRTILSDRVAQQAGLRPGDVLQSAGGRSLAGKGPITVYAAILDTPPEARPVAIDFVRDGTRGSTVLDVSPLSAVGGYARIVYGALMATVSVIILLRAPRTRISLPLYLVMNGHALNMMWFPGGPPMFTYAWVVVFALSEALYTPLFVVLFMVWVDRPLPRWAFGLPWLLSLKGFLRLNSLHEVWLPAGPSLSAFAALDTVMLVVGGTFAVADYGAGDALERRRLRWVGYGLAVGLLPMIALNLVAALRPELFWLRQFGVVGLIAIPLGLLMAIVRYDWLDIDRLIGATASVSLLGFALLAGVLTVIPRIAQSVGAATGSDPQSAQTMLSVACAALIVPGHRILRPRIERLFFRERQALESGIGALLDELAACQSPSELLEVAGERLDSLLRPDVCAIYAASPGSLTSVFNRGQAVPPAIDAEGSLAVVMAQRRSPIGARALRADPRLGPAERAVLGALGASVIFPVMVGRSLQYLACLGTKRSGDIYTQTDLALIGRVADTIGAELLRFDDAEVIRQGREMQEALRCYVPGAIAEQLIAGERLESGECEVSVLFVDIRGYTSISQGLEPDAIFSTVNRYTETVSGVVRAHGGTIVEFNGDGMMSVFGAPRELPAKERCAVEAAREIILRVAGLEPAAPVAGTENLSCGVGVATGPAFVGNIQAVDRYIWSAIGNTTNLAARLEGLTRTVDASIVIDAATWAAAGDAVDGFSKRADVSIRGRSDPQDLYLLPLTS